MALHNSLKSRGTKLSIKLLKVDTRSNNWSKRLETSSQR